MAKSSKGGNEVVSNDGDCRKSRAEREAEAKFKALMKEAAAERKARDALARKREARELKEAHDLAVVEVANLKAQLANAGARIVGLVAQVERSALVEESANMERHAARAEAQREIAIRDEAIDALNRKLRAVEAVVRGESSAGSSEASHDGTESDEVVVLGESAGYLVFQSERRAGRAA